MTQESESTSDSEPENERLEAVVNYLKRRKQDPEFKAAYERAMSNLRNGHDT
jgi:hypothetical protein